MIASELETDFGAGLDTMRHSATLTGGKPGVLHGVRTYILQDENGQVLDTHSVSMHFYTNMSYSKVFAGFCRT